jgi:uncharacterized membrane protein
MIDQTSSGENTTPVAPATPASVPVSDTANTSTSTSATEASLTQKAEATKEEIKAVENAGKNLAEENNVELEEFEKSSHGEKILSIVGYFSFFCILPIVVKPKSDLCQIHGKQGMVLTICYFLFSFVLDFFALFAEGLVNFMSVIVLLGYLGGMAYGIFIASQGKAQKMPVIGEVAEKLKW